MANREVSLRDQIQDLPQSAQDELFMNSIEQNKYGVTSILLNIADISAKSLTRAFYDAAMHNQPKLAKMLIHNPKTNINWVNKDNWGMSPAFRAASNHHDEIVEMIIDKPEFNPNVTMRIDNYLGVGVLKTIVTEAFGFTPKEEIKRPKEAWKQALLKDKRVDWELHAQLIERAKESQKETEIKSAESSKRVEKYDALEAKVSVVRKALGLDAPFFD